MAACISVSYTPLDVYKRQELRGYQLAFSAKIAGAIGVELQRGGESS